MIRALFWKLMERFGVQGIHFILQLVLARILAPELYGVLSIMVVFTTLANVFIQIGFNTALIQNKDVTDEDYSSVFWASLAIAVVMYGIIYVSAPTIGEFYQTPELVWPLRVLALILLPGAMNSIQLAKVSREMDFKKMFYSNIGGILVAGVVSIAIAYMGGGLWALVAQNLLNITAACIVMLFTANWRPRLVFNLKRVIVLFSFGWKLLVSSLLENLYNSLSSLVIGKKYDTVTLAYYNRGAQFPQFIINAINSAIQSVMLPAMSAEQDDKATVKQMMRNSMTMSAFVIFPMMAGLAAVATPLVTLLLTEKWLPCVPYMQIYCFTMAFYPIHSCNVQAINAMGRSDIFLKLEIVKKVYGIAVLAIAVFCFDSPMAIAASGLISTCISWLINALPNKKLIGYTYREQLRDVLPVLFVAVAMYGVVLAVGQLCDSAQLMDIVILVVQIGTGVASYLLLSWMFKLQSFRALLGLAGKILKK